MQIRMLVKSTLGKFGDLDRFLPLSDVAVDAGSLWQEIEEETVAFKVFHKFRRHAGQDGLRAYESLEERCLYVIAPLEHLILVPVRWAEMLLAVPDLKERLMLYRTENTLYCASRLSIGDTVNVELRNGKIIPGHLRWIGRTPLAKQGDFFGVEVPRGLGVTDGTCNGLRFFKCPPSSALFVPVSMLWFPPSVPPPRVFSSPASTSFYDRRNGFGHAVQNGSSDIQSSFQSHSEPSQKSSWLIDLRNTRDRPSPNSTPLANLESSGERSRRRVRIGSNGDGTLVGDKSSAASALPPLAIGERVVFLRDGDPEYGTVRWLGHLPGFVADMAGVEFDNPIGSGCGMYNGRLLFVSRMNHASLLPIEGLIRAIDFDKETSDYGSVQKNLLVEFEGMNDTSVWSVDQAETSSDSPSPPLAVTSPEEVEARTPKVFAMDQKPVTVGAYVQVFLDVNITTPPLVFHGRVRWVGKLPGKDDLMVGVELEKEVPYWVRCGTDGSYKNNRYFTCDAKRGVFVPGIKVRVCSPEDDSVAEQNGQERILDESMPKFPAPWKLCDLRLLIGKPKGIQGKNNSCYMDATLFAMFTGIDAFDGILSRPKARADIELYDEIRTCLKFKIATPLRWNGYVDQDAIMKLRRLISHALPNDKGWTDEEKDPEELINALFGPILNVEPDIHLTTGQSSYICQLVIDDAWQKTALTSVQTLMERSFFCSNVLLASAPDRLIVQLPRYGKQKLYDYIVPTLTLDLSNVVANRGRECGACGKPAIWQCKECYLIETNEYAMTFFCSLCFSKFHSALRTNNDHRPSSVPQPKNVIDNKDKPFLELASVICIESSHYVSFVRIRDGQHSKWLFFDSMADREGGDVTGHNIPEVIGCDEYFDLLLRAENRHLLVGALPEPVGMQRVHHSPGRVRRSSNPLPPFIDRLMQDCYICVYTRPNPAG